MNNLLKNILIYLLGIYAVNFSIMFGTLLGIFRLFSLKKLNECAKLILGEHDFTQLSKKNDEIKNKICMIYVSNWKKNNNNNQLIYNIIGNRFLHHMVRYLVGMMIEVSCEHKIISINDFKNILDGEKTTNLYKAPAKGLYLKNVYYD